MLMEWDMYAWLITIAGKIKFLMTGFPCFYDVKPSNRKVPLYLSPGITGLNFRGPGNPGTIRD